MFVLLTLLACGSADDGAPKLDDLVQDPATLTEMSRFRVELEAAGFLVQDGKFRELPTEECCSWQSCYLFNPDNRYATWNVPRGPGQTVANPFEDEDGTSGVFRMRRDEAVIAIGKTPPKAKYFSYRSYLHDTWNPVKKEREPLFASFGDSLNHLVAKLGDNPPFETDVVVATVADQGTMNAISEAAEVAGLGHLLNFDVIHGDLPVFGLQNEADTFRMQHRISIFEDEAAGDAWMADPGFTVWRVTPRVEERGEPIAAPELRSQGTGTNEEPWRDAMNELDQAIRDTYPGWEVHRLQMYVADYGDKECPMGCNRDTYISTSGHFYDPANSQSFVVAYGVNHERTGKSVYSNVALYGVEHAVGIDSIHSGEMMGSANAYLPGHPQVDDLFAVKIDRFCDGEPWCMEIPTTCPGFGMLEAGAVGFRAYVEGATASGPSVDELVLDRAIWFTRPLDTGNP